jgi:hypothetical protein
MKSVRFIRSTTLLENDKKWNAFQRSFFKATRLYDFNVVYPTNENHKRIYLFAYDKADLIHIGILGKLHGP